MAKQTPSYEGLSPRFRGFDAYFAREIAPHAPALTTRLPCWPCRMLMAAAVCYVAAAAAALALRPAEMADFRPWAFASFAILLPGMILSFLAPPLEARRAPMTRDAWRSVRRRIARFFSLDAAPIPERAALLEMIAACPAPPIADRFRARGRIAGRLRTGAAAGVSLDLVEGMVDGAPAALLQMQFAGEAHGLGALLDARIEGVARDGLAALATPLPDGVDGLAAYADSPSMAAQLTAPTTLALLAEMQRDLGATALNLAVIDDWARLYFPLTEPIYGDAGTSATDASVAEALFDYDTLVRFAESLQPLFTAATPAALDDHPDRRPDDSSGGRPNDCPSAYPNEGPGDRSNNRRAAS